jgi:hypothetical protein
MQPEPDGTDPNLPGERFLSDASLCLQRAGARELPDPLEADDRVRLTVRRLLEASAEQCDAMAVLQAESLHRPAHALLRMLLESAAYVVWLARDPARHAEQLWEDRQPPFRNVLERIGWEAEYELSYGPLSEFVHPHEEPLHMYGKLDSGSDGLLPEIEPDGEIYVLPEVEGVPYVSFSPMSREEAEEAYGLFVRAKAVDLVLSGLWDLFGPTVIRRDWWPTQTVEQFRDLLAVDRRLASQVQGRFLTPS